MPIDLCFRDRSIQWEPEQDRPTSIDIYPIDNMAAAEAKQVTPNA